MQVSADLSIVDLDVPFAFMFSLSASLNAYSNVGVLAVVTWQVLFVSVPMIVLAIRLQVLVSLWLIGYTLFIGLIILYTQDVAIELFIRFLVICNAFCHAEVLLSLG
jgi:hypothetical protein